MKALVGLVAFAALAPFQSLVAQDPTLVTIQGKVVDHTTGELIGGAGVSVSPIDVQVLSDSLGVFVLADLVVGEYWLSVTAEGFKAVEGDFRVERPGEFTVRMEPTGDPTRDGFGQVRGRVRDRKSGRALEAAQVTFPTLSLTALTDSNGRFSIREVPAGTFPMRTEYLGYGTRRDSLAVPPGHFVSVEVELSVEPVELEPLIVEVERQLLSLHIAGFYDRRETASGIFITRDEIVEKLPTYTADIFNSLPGVRVLPSGGLDRAVVLRAGMRPTPYYPPGSCGPTVYLDGLLYERGGPNSPSAFLDRIVRPDEIAGLEIYTSAATVPLQYKELGSDCGVIVIWTR